MYRKIEDFVQEWNAESESTLKIFKNISDESKAKKAGENIRSLDRLAWHITQTLTEMPARTGIIDQDYLVDEPIPDKFQDILLQYKKHSEELARLVQEKWTDAGLLEEIEVYGQNWERRKVLSVLVLHQAHHRGQMTTLMRLENLAVPGIYGPSKEEWSKYGMEAME